MNNISYVSVFESSGALLDSETDFCRIYILDKNVYGLFADAEKDGMLNCIDLASGNLLSKNAVSFVLGVPKKLKTVPALQFKEQVSWRTVAAYYFKLIAFEPGQGPECFEMPAETLGGLVKFSDTEKRCVLQLKKKGKHSGWLYCSEEGSETRPPKAGGATESNKGAKPLFSADFKELFEFFGDNFPMDYNIIHFSPSRSFLDVALAMEANHWKMNIITGKSRENLFLRVQAAAAAALAGGQIKLNVEDGGGSAEVSFFFSDSFGGAEIIQFINKIKAEIYEQLGCKKAEDKKVYANLFLSTEKLQGCFIKTAFPLNEIAVSVFEKEMSVFFPEGAETVLLQLREEAEEKQF